MNIQWPIKGWKWRGWTPEEAPWVLLRTVPGEVVETPNPIWEEVKVCNGCGEMFFTRPDGEWTSRRYHVCVVRLGNVCPGCGSKKGFTIKAVKFTQRHQVILDIYQTPQGEHIKSTIKVLPRTHQEGSC